MRNAVNESALSRSPHRNDRSAPQETETLRAELKAAHAREAEWQREKQDLSQQQLMLAQEFEHRLINGLQLIVSLLTLQSRTATPEAAEQLTAAALRVGALGRVHHQLHLLDHRHTVEFREYLERLCKDLSDLLFEGRPNQSIVVQGSRLEIPTALGIPLGFIVNELITNSAKYAKGTISVMFESASPVVHSLSVVDDGPGLPHGFDPMKSKGLGMRIVLSLVKQIGGELHILPAVRGCGARFQVTFSLAGAEANGSRAIVYDGVS